MLAKVPTAPEIAQVATSARAATRRCAGAVELGIGLGELQAEGGRLGVDAVASGRWSASSCARRRGASAPRAARRGRRAGCRRRATSCTARQVSSTSDEVMPWCTKRASGPTISARCVRKAMTSCLTSRSIASMRATSNVGVRGPSPRSSAAASFGMTPSSASASAACASISNQMRKRGLGRPDGDHFGAGVARDHARLLPATRHAPRARVGRSARIAAMLCGVGLRRPPLNIGGAGDQHVGAGRDDQRRGVGRRCRRRPRCRSSPAADHAPAPRAIFSQHRRDEGLAAEARVDGHHQDQVDVVEHLLDRARPACRD